MYENIEDTRKFVEKVGQYPYCCIGLINGKFGVTNYHGTGCLIAPRIVLTCAHNLYQRKSKKEATEIKFTPAANKNKGESYEVADYFYPDQFKTLPKKEIRQYDFAILELEEDASQAYGYLGLDTGKMNVRDHEDIEICGYPGDKEDKEMWTANGSVGSINEDFIYYPVPTETGQSGAPIVKKDGNVVGVHIGGNNELKVNFAVRLTKERRKIINKWISHFTGELNLSGEKIGDYGIQYLS